MHKPCRILYVQPYNWKSGPHQSLRALICNLDRTYFLPYVILPGPSAVAEEFVKLGAQVRFDSEIRTIPRSIFSICQLRFWTGAWASMWGLANLIRIENIRLVHVNSEACWVGGFAAKIAKRPVICHLHGLSVLSPSWMGRITTWVLNKFKGPLIAVSNEVRRAYLSSGASHDYVQTIYNGLDVETFNPRFAHPTLRFELGIEEGQPLVGMIANFDPRKGHHNFVTACALVLKQIPNAQFVIVGGNNISLGYFQQIQEMVSTYGLTTAVHFLGLRHDIPNILASLDVVVQASLTEAGPIVPIEAMAMERPIVVTDVGGNCEEVIDGQTGLVVSVGDIPAIADAMIRLISDPLWGRRLGKAGRERVLHMFTDEIYAQKVQQVYYGLLLSNDSSKFG